MKHFLLIAVLMITRLSFGQVDLELQKKEKNEVEKLGKLSAFKNQTIFFNGVTVLGFIREGKVHYIHASFNSFERCGLIAVSNNAEFLALRRRSTGKGECQTTIVNLATGEERLVGDDEPSEASAWSWDDSKIVQLAGSRLRIISSQNTNIVSTITFQPPNQNGWAFKGAGFVHSGESILASVTVCVPTKEPGTCRETDTAFVVNQGQTKKIAEGTGCSVSPTEDIVGCVSGNRVTLYDLAGNVKKRLSKVPFTLIWLPVIREEPWLRVVWSKDGNKLIYSTIIDEGGNSNIYLVDVRTGNQQRILHSSTLSIVAWR